MVASLIALSLLAQEPELRRDPTPVPKQPFARYFTKDRFGREITFYVSEAATDTKPAPLVLFIQGSGCGSNFVKIGERIVPQNGQVPLYDAAAGRIRLVMVEKPGVKFLDPGDRGGASTASTEFRAEHTLDRWAEAVGAALKAARKLDGVDTSKALVLGHSEGGLVACRVAAQNQFVTHCATLAGGGVSQLFDLVELARSGQFMGTVSDDPDKRVQFLLNEWKKVLADPDSAEKTFLGHPNRRWSSFLATSPLEELAKFKGKIYLAQGTADTAVLCASADALYSHLISRGRDVTYSRVQGGDHAFGQKDDKGAGWVTEMKRLLAWFESA